MPRIQTGPKWFEPSVRMIMLLAIAMLAGCSTIHGTPIRYQATSDIVKSIDLTSEDLANLQSSSSRDERNRLQNKAIAVIDQWFHQFVRDLNANRSDSSAAAAGAALGVSSAGAFVESVRAKTNYALLGGGLAAAFGIVDKEYFYEKTVPALVSSMGANRAQLLLRIKSSQRNVIEDYDGTAALADLEDYYAAGTVLSAISQITTTSETEKTESLEKVRQLDTPTDAEIGKRKAITTAIWSINDDTSLTKAQGVAKALGLTEPKTAKEARTILLTEQRQATPARRDALGSALANAGLLK